MPADPQPPTDEPELTYDHELSKWVPAYRQTRWDQIRAWQEPEVADGCSVAASEAASSTSLDQPGTGAGYTAVEPRPLDRRISAAILSAYRVPPDVLPAMVERVADAVRPDTAAGPVLGEEMRAAIRLGYEAWSEIAPVRTDEQLVACIETALAPHVAALIRAAERRGRYETDAVGYVAATPPITSAGVWVFGRVRLTCQEAESDAAADRHWPSAIVLPVDAGGSR